MVDDRLMSPANNLSPYFYREDVAVEATRINIGIKNIFCGNTDEKANRNPSKPIWSTRNPTVKPTINPLIKSRIKTTGRPITDKPRNQIKPSILL